MSDGFPRRPSRGRSLGVVAAACVMTVVGACTFTAPTASPPTPAPGTSPPRPPSDPRNLVDPALAAWSILPPGNGNVSGFTATHSDDQRAKYDLLDNPVADGTLTDGDLGRYFEDEHLGAGTIVRTDRPADGVSIEWDSAGVPHVHGDTADDVAFGAGWSVAEARLYIAEIGRLLGRAGSLEMGGPDIPTALAKLGSLPRLAYTDAELEAGLTETVAEAGAEGPAMLSALDAFVAGLNHWLDTNAFPPELTRLGLSWRHWNRADVLAVGIIVDDIFGAGGGDEVGNAAALASLVDELGETSGRATFADLRTADDRAATTHVDRPFPFPLYTSTDGGPSSAVGVIDDRAVALPDRPVPTDRVVTETPTMSNYIVLAGSRTASGHPILVGGPQSSYTYPQLLFEIELQGGGYDSRGITFPGLGPWVVIGRSRTYAWTATAGGSDLTDQRVERLCEPDGSPPAARATHYVFNGICTAMSRTPGEPLAVWRTVHGPVVAWATVDGAPVAISRQRMSRAQTAHAATAFWKLNRAMVGRVEDFAPTMSTIPMSFNWMYVNEAHVAYFHSGWYPIRAQGVDPDLPSWGTGEWEWKGRMDWHDQPQAIDPPSGIAVSWNNKVAPGWRESDNDWDAGVIQRVDTIGHRASRLDDATPADVVVAAQDAATVDVRGELVLPEILAVLEGSAAPTPRAEAARAQLARWSSTGAHRRDRNDDGFYDDLAVAVMDQLFERLVRDEFGPGLGAYFTDAKVRRPRVLDNPPSQTGGAFAHGWYSAMTNDLRRVRRVQPTPSDVPVFCGGGDLERCRAVIWHALSSASSAAGSLPRWAVPERIRFIPYVSNARSVRWVNRPTFQQVISFGP